MTEKDLRKLSRAELIDMLITAKKTELQLRAQLEEARKMLEDRRLRVENAGSLAEAAMALNGVFEAAQAAAEDYLRAVREEVSKPRPSGEGQPADAAGQA